MSTRKKLLTILTILTIYLVSRGLGQLLGLDPRIWLTLPLFPAILCLSFANGVYEKFRLRDSASFWITVGLLVAIAQETLSNKVIIPNTILIGLLAYTLVACKRKVSLAYDLICEKVVVSMLLLLLADIMLVAAYAGIEKSAAITGFTFFLIAGNVAGWTFNYLARNEAEARLSESYKYRLTTVFVAAAWFVAIILIPISLSSLMP